MASDPAPADKLEEERRLVEEARQGNLDAMRPIFEQYSGPLYSAVIMPRLGDPVAAEDVLRDTLTTAIEKLHKFRWKGRSIYSWLRQIAINKVYDVHRRSKRSLQLANAVAQETPANTLPESRADVLLIAAEEQEINRARIEKTLGAISERYRLAIELRLIRELSREECAQELDVTVGNFDVIFFRAIRAFRNKFGAEEQ